MIKNRSLIMTFAELVKKRRFKLGMSQFDLGVALNITPTTISSWERGATKPQYDTLINLAKVLGVTELELLHPETIKEENEDSKNVQ